MQIFLKWLWSNLLNHIILYNRFSHELLKKATAWNYLLPIPQFTTILNEVLFLCVELFFT